MAQRTMIIPLGPQHPALKEPENFTFTLDGEIVVDVDLRLGYVHRGIEKAFEGRTYLQNVYLAERICGICSQAHTTTYVQAVEELLDLEVPPRGLYIRAIVNELNRIHSHILWLGVAGHEIGWDTLFHYSWRDRESCLDVIEEITGNRVNYAHNVIGGVRRDISKDRFPGIVKRMNVIEKRINEYKKTVLREQTVLDRALGVGVLKPEVGKALCATGPTLRASNVKWDLRATIPRVPYNGAPFEIRTSDLCDVAGRLVVRLDEVVDCCHMITHWLKEMPNGDISARASRRVPEGQAVSRFEAPRGEVIHVVVSDGTDKPYRHKARAPTMANLPATCEMLKGCHIADIPITLASIDPCFSCTDRFVIETPDGHREDRSIDWLRAYGRRYYEKHKPYRR